MATYLPNVTDVLPDPALYTPDFSFLDTMLRRRQAMYEQGFAEVSSAYNTINRDVTNPYNAQQRDRFLVEARSRLKNLAAMDLSQRQNVSLATSVFQPFYSNRSVLGDQALTAHWNQQRAVAETYRLKDGGKEYSEDNVRFFEMQREQFAQDDPTSWNRYYSSRRYYTPYHNYTKEVMEAMDKFKPSKSKITTPDGRGYLVTQENESIDPEEVKNYLNSVLSENAKRQMSIEGVVRYSNNPAVFENYAKTLDKTEKYLNNTLEELGGKLMAEKDPARRQEYETLRSALMERIETIATDKQNLANPEYLQRNREEIASRLYYSDKVQELSKAFARKNTVYEMKPDDVYLTRLREAGLNRRHRETLADNAANRQNDRLLKMVDLGLLTFDTQGNIVRVQDQPFVAPTGKEEKGTDYQRFQAEKQNVINDIGLSRENLKKYFYTTNPIYQKNKIPITDPKVEAAFDQFLTDQAQLLKTDPKSNKLSRHFLEYRQRVEAQELRLRTFDEKERQATQLYEEDLGDIKKQVENAFGGKSLELNLYDSKTRQYTKEKIDADRFIKLFLNSKSLTEDAMYGRDDANYIVSDGGLKINIDGKSVTFAAGSGKAFKDAFNILKSNKPAVSGARKRFNELYDISFVQNETFLRPINEKDPLVVAAKNNMQNATLVPADNIVISGYNSDKYMFGFKTNVKKEDLPSEQELAARGIVRAPGYTDQNPVFIASSNLFTPRTGDRVYSAKERAVVDYLNGITMPTPKNPEVVYGTPTGLLTVGQGINPVQVIKTSRYGQPDVYDIKDEMTGILLNTGPLTLDQVIQTMRALDNDPAALDRIRNYKPRK